jgi:hypothetical protein
MWLGTGWKLSRFPTRIWSCTRRHSAMDSSRLPSDKFNRHPIRSALIALPVVGRLVNTECQFEAQRVPREKRTRAEDCAAQLASVGQSCLRLGTRPARGPSALDCDVVRNTDFLRASLSDFHEVSIGAGSFCLRFRYRARKIGITISARTRRSVLRSATAAIILNVSSVTLGCA